MANLNWCLWSRHPKGAIVQGLAASFTIQVPTNEPRKVTENNPSDWTLNHVGDLEEASGCWLWPGSDSGSGNVYNWRVNQQMEGPSVSPSLSVILLFKYINPLKIKRAAWATTAKCYVRLCMENQMTFSSGSLKFSKYFQMNIWLLL